MHKKNSRPKAAINTSCLEYSDTAQPPQAARCATLDAALSVASVAAQRGDLPADCWTPAQADAIRLVMNSARKIALDSRGARWRFVHRRRAFYIVRSGAYFMLMRRGIVLAGPAVIASAESDSAYRRASGHWWFLRLVGEGVVL